MRKILSGSLAVFAGMVSLPAPVAPHLGHKVPAPDYRQDPRLVRLRNFFAKSDCPATRYAHIFLEAADDYGLDWRLLPSISYVESTGGKAAPHNNLFGWDSGKAQFHSPAASIHTIGYRLAYSPRYRDKSVDEVLATYNPMPEYVPKVKSVMRRISPVQ